MVDENSLELIKERSDIVEIVGQYVKLRKRGLNFQGLCPFHNEKTPSFVVSPDKKIFHCFGCGAGGNVFTFLMKIDGLSFIDTVKLLAEKSGVEINDDQMINFEKDDREVGFLLLSKVKDSYHSQLSNEEAKNFLKTRGLDQETVDTFQLGYSSKVYCDELLGVKDVNDIKDDLIDIGIGIDAQGKVKDRFYKRFMFPIIDLQGRTLGFGGRIISGEGAKYVNSPETRFYHKSNVLYGLNMAKKYIRENNDQLILVEGYMDAISVYQAGIKNISAVLGTAVTPQQFNLVKRFVKLLYMCFDNDDAGKNAMYRVNDVLQDPEVEVKVIGLKDSKDPDEYIKKYGVDSFRKQMVEAITYKEFLIDHSIGIHSKVNGVAKMAVEDKSRVLKELKAILRFENDIIKNEYISIMAKKLGVDLDQVKSYFFTYNSISSSKKKDYKVDKGSKDKFYKLEEDVLAILLSHTSLRKDFLSSFLVEDFSDIEHKKIFALINNNPEKDVQFLCDLVSSQNIISICMKDNYANPKFFLQEALDTIKKRNGREKIAELTKQIIELEKNGDFDKLMFLNQQLSELIKNK
jgi:DNA primase